MDIECPDCSNDYMILDGEKMDIVNRKEEHTGVLTQEVDVL